MKSILLLAFAFSAITFASAACDACLDGYCYTKKKIVDDATTDSFAIDRSTNTLYLRILAIDNGYYNFKCCSYNLDYGGLTETSTSGFHTYAIDQSTHDIFVAFYVNRIYKLNPHTKEYTLYKELKEDIAQLYFKDRIYYRDVQDRLYEYGWFFPQKVHGLNGYKVHRFVVDKYNDIYFKRTYEENDVYKLEYGASEPKLFIRGTNITYEYILTTDNYDRVLFINVNTHGVYRLDYNTNTIQLVGAINGSGNNFDIIVFDRDNNMVYGEYFTSRMYHFKRVAEQCSISIADGKNVTINVGGTNATDYKELNHAIHSTHFDLNIRGNDATRPKLATLLCLLVVLKLKRDI